jgi:hypothetical protein
MALIAFCARVVPALWVAPLLTSLWAESLPRQQVAQQVTGTAVERRALEAAVQLLPTPLKNPIVVIDPEGVPDTAAVRQLDAFTVLEADGTVRPKIYINRESLILRAAVRSDFYRKVLAAVLVHEATHLRGGSESAARDAESQFFTGLIARGLVRSEDGLRYLALLRRGATPDDSSHRPQR